MVVNVDGGVQVEPAGVVGRVGDRFPLTVAFGVVATDGTPVADGRWTPFGMTVRVAPVDPVRVDWAGVGYDEVSQTSTWPHPVSIEGTSPPTWKATQTSSDGANGPDVTPDQLPDVGVD